MVDEVLDSIEKAMEKVDQAVSRGDFSNLGSQISDIFNDESEKKYSERTVGSAGFRKSSGSWKNTESRQSKSVAWQRYSASGTDGEKSWIPKRAQGASWTGHLKKEDYIQDQSSMGPAIIIGFGIAGLLLCGIPGISLLSGGWAIQHILGGFLTVAAAGFGALSLFGASRARRINRLEKYKSLLSEKHYASVKELAEAVGRSEKKTVRELKEMIQEKTFPQGHLDAEEKTFMLSDEFYSRYQELQIRKQEIRKAEEAEEAEYAGLPSEVVQMIRKGRNYIKEIHESNDAIPDPVISEKLDRMETIVTKIFEEVREKPALARKLNTLMDYYLPTTEKLLKAYRDLGKEPIQGENIQNTRREIENSLDIINDAYEALLDSLYENEALDLTTDISVMKTVMKQQGLTPGDLKAQEAKGEWENGPTLEQLNEEIRQHEKAAEKIELK